jgi:hypothetical protein
VGNEGEITCWQLLSVQMIIVSQTKSKYLLETYISTLRSAEIEIFIIFHKIIRSFR